MKKATLFFLKYSGLYLLIALAVGAGALIVPQFDKADQNVMSQLDWVSVGLYLLFFGIIVLGVAIQNHFKKVTGRPPKFGSAKARKQNIEDYEAGIK